MNAIRLPAERPVSEIMQAHVHSIGMDDSLSTAEAFLNQHGLSWAPVVGENREPIGVLSVDDLIRFRVQGSRSDQTPAWRLCTYRPATVPPNTAVSEVARLMLSRKIHHVVIVEHGEMKGVVSSLDLVQLLA